MRTSRANTYLPETQIQFRNAEIKLEEVDVNILEFWQKPVLSFEGDNYVWNWNISLSTDVGEEEPCDVFTCYISGELLMKGEKYFVAKINTLHTYHLSKLSYKKENEELFRMIARESSQHAKELLYKTAKGTEYEQIPIPEEDEDELAEMAEFWNKRGYIPKAAKPNKNALGRKLTKKEMDELSKKTNELVAWIDAHDETAEAERTEKEATEYWMKYAEWAKLNKQLWHFKLIARNTLAYTLTKIMVKMEKGLKEFPDDHYLRETYEGMKEDYESFMAELKDEFAKN